MNSKQYEKKTGIPKAKKTLLFLVDESSICLAMKKRGFGEGRYNGVGGKVENNETVVAAVKREAKEEIGIEAQCLSKVATLNFYFPHKTDWHQQVIVYICDKWSGKPKESEEMKPEWFKKTEVPYHKMWSDDVLWLPQVINGKKVKATFVFAEGDITADYHIKVLG